MIFKIILRTTIAYLLVGFFLFLVQDFLIFPRLADKYLNPDSNYSKLPSGISQSFVETTDGQKLDLWTNYNPADYGPAKKPENVAIIFHGNGETVASGNFLPFFKKQGIPAFTFDYRGYGKSTGWPSEDLMYSDAQAVFEYVSKMTGVDKDKFILLGNSIGTGFASDLASRIEPKALILIAPYYSFRDLILDRVVYAPFVFFLRYEIPTIEFINQTRKTCIIVAHGKKDNVIPFSQSVRIVESLKTGVYKAFLKSENAGHNDIFYAVEDELSTELQKCLKIQD